MSWGVLPWVYPVWDSLGFLDLCNYFFPHFREAFTQKINTQKSLVFLYSNNEKTEREIKETISFTTATKRIKHLGVYLPKETKDLYIENYKTLMKEIREDTKQMEKYTVFMGWKNQYCENGYTTQSNL